MDKSMLGKAWVADAGDHSRTADGDIVTGVLSARGMTDPAAIQEFLNPSIHDQMPDPFVLKDIERAVGIVADAIAAGEKIAVFGDYDVDGITSTAIMLKYLRAVGADPLWHLPNREGEGYGLNPDAIRDLHTKGARVLITVDCGISAAAEIALAKELGIKVIVTDHHSPDATLPNADAVVNPKRSDDESGLTYLAGVGVAFMFLVALNRALRAAHLSDHDINLIEYMDLVSLGTICDMMPLVNLNRAFVATGLRVLETRQNLGLRTLMDVAGVRKPSTYSVGFVLGPRLNAAGRLDSANPALDLLLTDNPLIARDLAEKLHKMNAERLAIQNAIMLDAAELAEKCAKSGKCSLFLCGENWHGGIMGIVAGRLKDQFCMPACVATKSDGIINGSGRSVPGVDMGRIIHEALAAGILTEGGGHAAAAGFTLPEEKENEFCEFLESAVAAQLGDGTVSQQVVVDAEIDAGSANMRLVREMEKLAPFGQGNPEPTIVVTGGVLVWAGVMGRGTHLRGNLRTSAGTQLPFVGFNMAGTPVGEFLLDEANFERKIILCGKLKENEYQGRVSAQFVVEDIAV